MSREMDLARGRLIHASPWLAAALGRLEGEPRPDVDRSATDGAKLVYPEGMSGAELAQALAHCTAHCLLGHVFERSPDMLAADISVALLLDRSLPEYCACRDEPLFVLAKQHLVGVPLEGVAAAVRADPFFSENAAALRALSRVDDHGLWAAERPFRFNVNGGAGEGWRGLWCKYGSRLQGRRAGRSPGTVSKAVRLGDAPHRGYRELLSRYAALRELPGEDPDTFEYGLYAYGLECYGNMPLIEPAESREAKRIDELAIVIDTSGSCIEELTVHFLNETRAMLADDELFAPRFNLHILQCDAKVQRDDHITCVRDFEQYIDGLRIVGGGGTDYRPAFERIDRLIERGAWRRLPAALFLTDGLGLYPAAPPEYEAVFIFHEGHYDAIDVPRWARTLVLEEAIR